MNPDELRKLSTENLQAQLATSRQELMIDMRFKRNPGSAKLEGYKPKLQARKRLIAQILTILNERGIKVE